MTMIEIPVLKPPDVLDEYLTQFRPLFNRRQYRQFCRYVTASMVTPTRSVAHMNGVMVEHTNQSNLNRFLSTIDTMDMFRKSVSLINSNSSDPILVLDDTVLQRSGKHIDGAGWVYDHSQGKSVWGMSLITAAVSCSEGIFPLNVDIKPVHSHGSGHGLSKITMQMAVIKRAISAGLNFTMAVFDSWYFASKLVNFLESHGKDWISEAKSDRVIFTDGRWIPIGEYASSLNRRKMKSYTIGEEQYLTYSTVVKMRKIGDVRIIISLGKDGKKFFVTNRIDMKPKRIMEMYLRRWDIEVMHREYKQDGSRRIYQRVFAGLLRGLKLSLLGDLLLELSADRSMATRLKIRSCTPGLRHRSMALRLLNDLFLALEEKGKRLLDSILDSIGKPYTSTIAGSGGQNAKL